MINTIFLLALAGLVPEVRCSIPSIILWTDVTQELFPVGIFPYSGISMTDPVSYSAVPLGPVLGQSERSTAYEIQGDGYGWVVKYTVFCEDIDDVTFNVVDREVQMLLMLNDFSKDLAPPFLMASNSIAVPNVNAGKVVVAVNFCPPHQTLKARYIVCEHTGLNLHQLLAIRERMSVPVVAAIGLQMMRVLSRIHELNVVHGDVHWGHFAVGNGDLKYLTMLGFGRARMVSETPTAESGVSCGGFMSMWEAQALISNTLYTPSFRDDIFRAVQIMAALMYGYDFVLRLENVCESDPNQFAGIMSSVNLFDFDFARTGTALRSHSIRLMDTVDFPSIKVENTRYLFNRLMAAVRAPVPDHDLIEDILTEIVKYTHESPEWIDDVAYVDFEALAE